MKPTMLLLTAGSLVLPSCARVTVDPIEVKPIHIVLDVNVRIDRQLDEFFAFEQKYDASTTRPATQAASAGDGPSQGAVP